jgi:hypothetical protein
MEKVISGYLWAFRNFEAGRTSLKSLRKFYPDSNLYINVDYDGDVENYTKIGDELNATVTVNNFQLGYCGDFQADIPVGRPCWPKEYTFEWVRGIYEACRKDDAEYMMLLEEDDYILKPITMLNEPKSMVMHPTAPSPTGRMRPNPIPSKFKEFIVHQGGNPESPGYAAGGGTYFNREQFIKAWETHKDVLWENYDDLVKVSKIIGWADYILQFIMQLDGHTIDQNPYLAEHWEVGDKWDTFEIITGFKDHTLIK